MTGALTRRALFNRGGQGLLAAALAPLGLKAAKATTPALTMPPSVGGIGKAEQLWRHVKSPEEIAVRQAITLLNRKNENGYRFNLAGNAQFSHSVAALKSVQPWAKAIIMEHRQKERESLSKELHNRLQKILGVDNEGPSEAKCDMLASGGHL